MKYIYILITVCYFYSLALTAQKCITPQRYLSPVFDTVEITSDITFGEAKSWNVLLGQSLTASDLKMDVYEPKGDTLSSRPVIVFSFGGAFLIGSKNFPPISKYAEAFAKKGFVFIAINYRKGFNPLQSESSERAMYRATQDLSAALRYLKQHQKQYRIDLENLFLMGNSAGGITSLHYAFTEQGEKEGDWPKSIHNGVSGLTTEKQDLGCLNCSGNEWHVSEKIPIKGIVNLWGAMLDTSFIEGHKPSERIPVLSYHGIDDKFVSPDYAVPFDLTQNSFWDIPFVEIFFYEIYGSRLIHKHLDALGIKNKLVLWEKTAHEPVLLKLGKGQQYINEINDSTPIFLYDLMKDTVIISGNNTVESNTTYSYNAPLLEGAIYCWSVDGGDIIHQKNNTVDVRWNETGQKKINVQMNNHLNVVSKATLNVQVNDSQDTSTHIRSIGYSTDVILYPNPIYTNIYVKSKTVPIKHIKIVNITGNTVWEDSIKNKNKDILIHLNNIAAGYYVIFVTTTDENIWSTHISVIH